MGSAKRMRPQRLGEKLLAIRKYFDSSLADMAARLSNDEFTVRRTAISQFKLNDREPALPVLLRYSRLSGISVEILIDDNLDIPEKFL